MNYLILDLETGSKEVYNRKGHFLFNPLVAVGLKNKGELKLDYLYPNKLKELEIDEDILVGHNIKYDLLYLWELSGIQEFFKRGGKIWDTMIVHYLLSGQKEKFPGLREITVKDYKCQERSKLMEEYWNKGIDTTQIPKDVVIKDLKGDVLDTEQVYLKQLQLIKEARMEKLIETEMDFLLACTEMEFNGMYINKEVFKKNKEELKLKLNKVQTELKLLTDRYWK